MQHWIKMRTNLDTDPAVIGMAERLGTSEYAVVGMLHHFWCWAGDHSEDGRIDGVTAKWLDRHMQVPGFAAAMQDVGWLRLDDAGLVVPKWDRHNGDSAKERAQAAERQERKRDRTSR